MNKVTMQDIADALGISRVTVWKVFNNYASVSAPVRESVLAKVKEMGYVKGISEPEQTVTNVSVIVSRPNSATFWTDIIHRLAQELYLRDINMIYTYMPSSYSEKFRMPSALYGGTVQGAIVLNIYDEKLLKQIGQLKLPKVFLDMAPQFDRRRLGGDLVLLEGFRCIYRITESVIKKGVRDIGFIGNIHYAKTHLDRYEGFCKCMADHGLEVREEICMTSRNGPLSYETEIYEFADSLEKLPEAFVCASDQVAHYLQLYLGKHPEKSPDGLVVTGYSGSSEYTNVDELITTTEVNADFLGQRLAMQLLYRMEHADAPYEMTLIQPSIVFRDSVLWGRQKSPSAGSREPSDAEGCSG